MARKEVSLIVTTNYGARIFKRSLSLPVVRAVLGFTSFLALAAVVVLVWAGVSAFRLARLSYLETRNRELEAEHGNMVQLAQRVVALETQHQRMAEMLGVDKTPPEVNWGVLPSDSTGAEPSFGSRSLPTIPPLEDYVVSRGFGKDHPAIDLAAQSGTPVRAAADGRVEALGTDSVFGKFVLLQHGQGYKTYYAHLTDWKLGVADTVKAGQEIGTVGSTGRSSAPHLHFEIRRDEERIDPGRLVRF